MTAPTCDVCGLPFLRHQAAEEKIPPAARHRFTSTRSVEPARRVQEDLGLTTPPGDTDE